MKRVFVITFVVCICLALCACSMNQQGQSGNSVPGIVDVDTGKEFADMIVGYVNSGDYIGAIQYYNSLSESVKSKSSVAAAYINAVSAYKSDVMRQVDNYIAAGDFTAARSLLKVAENQIGNDVTISTKMKEVNEKELLKTVLEFETAKNYEAAISYLNQNSSVVSGSMELQVKLETYKEQYRNAVIAQATDAYEKDGVNAALSVLNNALKVSPNDDVINAERTKYENAAPISMLKIDCTKKGRLLSVGTSTKRIHTDVSGNTYSGEGVHYTYGINDKPDDSSECSITYFLNKKYDILSGVIFRPYATMSHKQEWDSDGSVEIYGDGVLIYSASVSQDTYDPIRLRVDVSGVRELTIEIKGWWKEQGDYMLYHYYSKCCIADLKVAKEP